MNQQEMTIQQIVNLYSVENVQPMLEAELRKSNTNLYVPQPCCPKLLQQSTHGGHSVIKYVNGEPFIDENVELENLHIGALRSLFLFISEYANFYSGRLCIVKIEAQLLSEQLKAYKSSLAITLKENKIKQQDVKDYQNIDTAAALINASLLTKKAEVEIMTSRYDGYRRLINALSREATNRGNFNEYNNQGNSSSKWGKDKGGSFGNIRT